jgi:hypothetical protein
MPTEIDYQQRIAAYQHPLIQQITQFLATAFSQAA